MYLPLLIYDISTADFPILRQLHALYDHKPNPDPNPYPNRKTLKSAVNKKNAPWFNAAKKIKHYKDKERNNNFCP